MPNKDKPGPCYEEDDDEQLNVSRALLEFVIVLLIFQKSVLTETLIKLVKDEEIISGPPSTPRTFAANTLASHSSVTIQQEEDQSFVNFKEDDLGWAYH